MDLKVEYLLEIYASNVSFQICLVNFICWGMLPGRSSLGKTEKQKAHWLWIKWHALASHIAFFQILNKNINNIEQRISLWLAMLANDIYQRFNGITEFDILCSMTMQVRTDRGWSDI